jgi:hypothetical protein
MMLGPFTPADKETIMRMETMDTSGHGDIGVRRLEAGLGLTEWQLRLAREHGLLPEPDRGGRWSAELADECRARVPQIVSAFGRRAPVGAGKAAARLAQRLRLDVEKIDIEVLVARGDLTMIGSFRRHPIYLQRDLDGLDAATVAEVVAARKGPLLDRVDAKGAALILGWTKGVFSRIAAERGLPADRLGRYALTDVRALAEDGDLTARVRAELREHALRQARRNEERHEDAVRNWMLRCTAFLDRTTDEPPDTATATRALKAIVAARSALAGRSGDGAED